MFIKRRVETNEYNLKDKKKMIKKFIIVTTGRSDYGMLKKLANELEKDKKKRLLLLLQVLIFQGNMDTQLKK